jgi:hypothetical protein
MSMNINMECDECVVAQTCPRKGSSPQKHNKITLKCRIIGGFGREPVDKSVLSAESLEILNRDGPCLTIAEVPSIDEEGFVSYDVVKIFSPPCLTAREKNVAVTSSDVTVRSHK